MTDDVKARVERDGMPGYDVYPICPVCGLQCDTFYKDNDGDIVGCDQCITATDAWEEVNE